MSRRRYVCVFLVLIGLTVTTGWARTFVDIDGTVSIDAMKGVDRDVDYEALVRIGPWDDRNYQLTAEDLAILPANEADLRSPMPAFFRVAYRRAWMASGAEQFHEYPLSAFNEFRQHLAGFLVDGTYYRKAVRRLDRYYVNLDVLAPLAEEEEVVADGVSGEVRITSPNGAAESAIAISPTDPTKLVAGSNGPLGGQRMHFSVDGGETWTQRDLPLGGTCCDPTVEWSTDGRYAYTAALGGCSGGCRLWFYRSDDGGMSWTSLEEETPGSPRREVGTFADREFLHVDQSRTSPYKDNIYMMWHRGNVMRFSKSEDFGDTWSTLAFSSTSEDRGIAGDIATDRSGNIYYFWPSFNSQTIRVRKSTDGGQTFGPTSVVFPTNAAFTFPIPAMESREPSIYIAADVDLSNGPFADRVYLSWMDSTAPESDLPSENHARIQVAYSWDGGQTWKIRTPHEIDDMNDVDRFQSFLAVGPDGTVHVIYYDTRRSPARTAADVFYSFSMDGADTWSTPARVTTEMSPNINTSFEFGDYNGLDIVMNDLIAIFTDNRNESGGSGNSVDVYAAGITPGGAGAAGRIPGSADFEGPPLVLDRVGTDLELTWSQACGSVGDYAIYEGLIGDFENLSPLTCSTSGLISTTVTPSAGNRFYLIVATAGDAVEGSYGQSSDGTERLPSLSSCHPQTIEYCP